MRISTYKYLLLVLLSVFIHFKANAQITIDVANINSCTGSISISVGGGVGPYSYVWSFSPPGDGVTFTDTGLITSSIFNQIPGFYRVVVTDANKDAVTATYQISDSTTITANIKFAGLVCVEDPSSGVIILTFNNGTPPFTWQLLDNNNSSQLVNFGGDLQTNFILINQDTNGDRLGVGDYRFEWSDVNGCSGIIANILITEPAPTNLTINTETGVTCFGGTDGEVNLSVTGGYGANYTVAIVAVGAPEPTLGDYINIGGGGSYTVSNLPTGDYRAYYFDRLSLPPFTTTYGLDVADYNTCQKFEPFTISSPAELLTNISGEILSCFGDTNGNITGTISGGTAPYTITLDQGGSQITVNTDGGTFDFSGLIVGSYNFSIVDAVGCGITAQASITQPDELTTSFDSLTNVMCNNDTTGSITINVTGGTPNYIFDINGSNVIPTSNSGNSYTFGNLGAGNYTITITDQNNCTATNTIIQPLTEPTAIIVNTIGEALSCFGDTDGNITGTISGGAPPYTITLDQGGSQIIVNTDGGSFDFSGLSAGNYTFSIVDASGCTTTAQNSITQPAAIPISAIKQDISCFGLTDGILTVPYSTNYTYVLTQLATRTPITNSVQGTDLIYTDLSSGNYRLEISGAGNNGATCTVSLIETINEPLEITASSTLSLFNSGTGIPINISCNGATDGSIDLNISGGTGSYTYSWTTVDGNIPIGTENNQDLNGLVAGTYSVQVSDQNSCQKAFDFTLNEPRTFTNTAVVTKNNFCFSGELGSITSQITNNGSVDGITYTYTITGMPALPGSYTSVQTTTALSATFTNLPAGDYQVSVVDENGCVSNSNTVTVTQPSNPISITSTMSDYFGFGVECNGDTNGTITLNNITGGTPNGAAPFYTVSWTGPNRFVSPLSNLRNLEAGAYSLTITDANGCEYLESFEITEPDVLTLSGTPSDYNGFGISGNGLSNGSIDITTTGGTSNYAFAWTTLNGTIPAGQEIGKDLTGLVAGTYTVLITDENGCTISESWTLTEPDLLLIIEVTASHVNNLCFGDTNGVIEVSIAQQSVSPYDYILTISAGGAIVAQVDNLIATNYIFSSLPAGTYTVTVRDANNNTDTLTDIIISEPPSALLVNSTIRDYNGFQVECNGESNGEIAIITSGGAPNYTFAWTTTNGIIPAGQEDDESLTGLVAGTYRLNVEDANGCTYQEDFIISEPSQLLITTNNADNISCNSETDGRILITPSGGTGFFTYAWTKDNITYATTEDITGLGAGEYILTLSDTNNCTAIANYTIIEPAPIVIIVDAGVDILCNGGNTGAIDLTINGGTLPYAYSWTKDGNPITETTQGLSNQTAGTYEVTVTDASGCSVNETIVLTESTEIVVSYTKTKISCYNANDGTMNVTLSGGLSPYTFTWSDLGNGLNRANLGPGIYTITVTDANGCIKAEPIEIIDAPVFEINPTFTNITCFGENDGSIDLNILGGEAPLIVTWQDDASAGLVRNNLIAGIYTVLIEEAGGCAINQSFTINEPALLLLDSSITNATVCDEPNSGAIDLQVTGGSPPFTFQWSNGATTEDLQDIGANDYTVTVIDSQGCQRQATFVVTRQAPIELSLLTSVTVSCENKTVIQRNELIIAGGVAPYSINWSNGTVSGTNGEIMHTGQNSTVIVKVTDSLGCTKELTFDVNLLTLGDPDFDFTSISLTQFGNLSIFDPIQFNNRSTGDSISFFWEFGDGTTSQDKNPIHSFSEVGTVTVRLTVYYPHGCAYSYTLTLNILQGYNLIIPTAFTPNGDGINDTIKPVFFGMESVKMSIFDTWGSLIYQEEGLNLIGWDGTVPGNFVENGNYLIIVKATSFNGVKIDKNGPVTLIK